MSHFIRATYELTYRVERIAHHDTERLEIDMDWQQLTDAVAGCASAWIGSSILTCGEDVTK